MEQKNKENISSNIQMPGGRPLLNGKEHSRGLINASEQKHQHMQEQKQVLQEREFAYVGATSPLGAVEQRVVDSSMTPLCTSDLGDDQEVQEIEGRFSEAAQREKIDELPNDYKDRKRVRADEIVVGKSRQRCKDHGGFCHQAEQLGLAEAAALDFRHRRERKIRVFKNWRKGMEIATDRFVFACCKFSAKYLMWYRRAKGSARTVTRDAVKALDESGDPLKNDLLTQEIVNGGRISRDTMLSVVITASKIKVDSLAEFYFGQNKIWVTPPLELWKSQRKRDACNADWFSEAACKLAEMNMALKHYDLREFEPEIITVPIIIEGMKWLLVDFFKDRSKMIEVYSSGWEIGKLKEEISALIAETSEKLEGMNLLQETLARGPPSIYFDKQKSSEFKATENGLVVALMCWARAVLVMEGLRINNKGDYLDIQAEMLYTNVELHRDMVKVLGLEAEGVSKDQMRRPDGYMGDGSYWGLGNEIRKPQQGAGPQSFGEFLRQEKEEQIIGKRKKREASLKK